MLVDHTAYGIPEQVGEVKVRALGWADFKGTPPQDSPYLAHIYWSVNYEFGEYAEGCQPALKVSVQVRPKSWRVKEDQKLLKHEYGHYLIGCLCALSFLKKATELGRDSRLNYGNWYRHTLSRCLKEYCAMERLYDDDSSHNLNKEGQLDWEGRIKHHFMEFYHFFEGQKRDTKKQTGRRAVRHSQPKLEEVKNRAVNMPVGGRADEAKSVLGRRKNGSIRQQANEKGGQSQQPGLLLISRNGSSSRNEDYLRNGGPFLAEKKVAYLGCGKKLSGEYSPLTKGESTSKEVVRTRAFTAKRLLR